MRFAICEDNIEMAGELEEAVCECYEGITDKFICDIFLSGEELIEYLENNNLAYQIYILDIEMKKINGLEVASNIRNTDNNAIIIFSTNHSELMQESFEVNAFNYLVKPIGKERVKQVILRAIETQCLRKKLFHYKVRKRINTLYFEQIEYFESYKRKIFIHTSSDIFEYYGILKEVNEQVDHSLFVQVHNSYIVNMELIKLVDAVSIELLSGFKIPVTKKYYKLFNLSYRNFILKRCNISD